MNGKKPLFDIEQLEKNLPEAKSEEEIRRLYAKEMAKCMQAFRVQCLRNEYRKPVFTAELTVKPLEIIKNKIRNFLTWVDELTPQFDVTPFLAPVTITRSLNGIVNRSITNNTQNTENLPNSFVFTKKFDSINMNAEVIIENKKANIKVYLKDNEGKLILPFTLTIIDNQTGELLVNKEFKNGIASLNGAEKGEYIIIATHATTTCSLNVCVK